MQSLKSILATVLAIVVSAMLCGAPPLAAAQPPAQAPPPNAQNPANGSDSAIPVVDPSSSHQQPPSPTGTSADPSQGPLEPVPPTPEAQQQLPNAPSATQAQPTGTPQAPPVPMANTPTPEKPQSEPVGTATAERSPTVGGAASKPAGAAIAPGKQRQVRSLVLKLGALAGAGVALGTVMALSKGTPSTPSRGASTTGH